MPRTRRIVKGESKLEIYCRKCMQTKSNEKFYSAKNMFLDCNGYMSICTDCISEIFEKQMNSTLDIKIAIYNTCKIIDIAYKDDCADSAKKYMETKMSKDPNMGMGRVFGWYNYNLSRIFSLHQELDRTFQPNLEVIQINSEEELKNEDEDFRVYLKNFWGSNFTYDEYQYLESELARWKRTHRCDTTAEETLLREICFTQLELKKAREGGSPTDSLFKRLTESMKISAVDPAKQNALRSNKNFESFGEILRMMEETNPADYFKDKDLFKDYDNIRSSYWENYHVRPAKNFITLSKDFTIREDGDIDTTLNEESEEE